MLVLAWAFAQSIAPVAVIEVRPRPAAPWSETTVARCGKDELIVVRPLYPLGQMPSINLNGKPLQGGNIAQLKGELGHVRAAYRLTVLCGRTGEAMTLRWVRGLADGRSNVAYRSGQALIARGAIIELNAEDSQADSFWFR